MLSEQAGRSLTRLSSDVCACAGGAGCGTTCPLLEWWLLSWESRTSTRGLPVAGTDLVVRTHPIEVRPLFTSISGTGWSYATLAVECCEAPGLAIWDCARAGASKRRDPVVEDRCGGHLEHRRPVSFDAVGGSIASLCVTSLHQKIVFLSVILDARSALIV